MEHKTRRSVRESVYYKGNGESKPTSFLPIVSEVQEKIHLLAESDDTKGKG
jgi:hypothetical protein